MREIDNNPQSETLIEMTDRVLAQYYGPVTLLEELKSLYDSLSSREREIVKESLRDSLEIGQ